MTQKIRKILNDTNTNFRESNVLQRNMLALFIIESENKILVALFGIAMKQQDRTLLFVPRNLKKRNVSFILSNVNGNHEER